MAPSTTSVSRCQSGCIISHVGGFMWTTIQWMVRRGNKMHVLSTLCWTGYFIWTCDGWSVCGWTLVTGSFFSGNYLSFFLSFFFFFFFCHVQLFTSSIIHAQHGEMIQTGWFDQCNCWFLHMFIYWSPHLPAKFILRWLCAVDRALKSKNGLPIAHASTLHESNLKKIFLKVFTKAGNLSVT